MVRIVRKADLVWLPWKNGGGEMADIAVSAERTPAGDPAWRVSTARVDRDGPFSNFPGVDRAMMLISGTRLDLHVDSNPPLAVCPGGPAIAFAGDRPTRGVPVGGGIANLNVMIRRATWRQRMIRWTLQGPSWLPVIAGARSFVFVQGGAFAIAGEAGSVCVAGDTLQVERPIEIEGTADLIEVNIWPTSSADISR